MSTTTLLDALYRSGQLRAIDHALARTLQRLDPDTPDAVLAAAALASLAVAQGHAGLRLDTPAQLIDAEGLPWPDAAEWQRALTNSRWVSTPANAFDIAYPHAPLVLEYAVQQHASQGNVPNSQTSQERAAQSQGLLYLRRYREYERRLAAGLHRIATQAPSGVTTGAIAEVQDRHPREGGDPRTLNLPLASAQSDNASNFASLAPLFTQLFPQTAEASPSPLVGEGQARSARERGHRSDHQQAHAAALALRHHLLLITGGPGTGKTTTIARLLVLLAAQAAHANTPPPRIALAAPTGRAAERMADSVRKALHALTAAGIDPALTAALPTTGTTLHRLLGTIPDSPRFRHGSDHPLPFDTVVVDEASMIDLPLMAKLVEAIPPGARLVLLGDPDQLPSVEAGDVLAGILSAASDGLHLPPADAEALTALVGADHAGDQLSERHPRGFQQTNVWSSGDPRTLLDQTATSMGSRLRGSDDPGGAANTKPHLPRIHLHHPWRQADTLHLAPLADAVRTGDSVTALQLLRGDTLPGVQFHPNLTDPLQSHRDALLDHWRSLATAATPAEALARAGRLRLLTAVREGPQGARTLNARIEALLTEAGASTTRRNATSASGKHFHGRLLLITQNSPRHQLFNGDIGIVLHGADGTATAWFPGDTPDTPRPFHPAALPAHDSAFAMTVHKAQGSEFDTVWLLLPTRPNRVLSRELIYTAITRARRELHVAGRAEVIEAALGEAGDAVVGAGVEVGWAMKMSLVRGEACAVTTPKKCFLTAWMSPFK